MEMIKTVKIKPSGTREDTEIFIIKQIQDEMKQFEKKKKLFLNQILQNEKKLQNLHNNLSKLKIKEKVEGKPKIKKGIKELIKRNEKLLKMLNN